jgi:NagD protein
MMDMSMNDRLRKIRHVVMDMDGTIYLGNQIFPFTLPFLKGLDEKGIGYSFLTNNPTKSPADYLRKLSGMGIEIGEDQMLTTSRSMVEYLKRHFPLARRIYVLGTESLQTLLRQSGYTLVGEEENLAPDVLVVSFDMTLTYRRLCKAAWWARQGVPYLATNPDWVCPTEEETVLVDCGSIQACIEAATGRKADKVLGKPDPTMLLELEAKLGLEKDEVAMVGDRAYTDVEMARRAGALPVLVLSGETTREMLPEVSRPGDLVVADLEEFGKLLLSHE